MRLKVHSFSFIFGIGCVVGSLTLQAGTSCCGNVSDAKLKDAQVNLLDLAFEAASAMPTMPHIKNRCRAQAVVVTAALELKAPQRTLQYNKAIDNWHQGMGYAKVGHFYARNGATKEIVEPYLQKAAQLAEETEDWRRDRIRVTIGQAYTLLGQDEQSQAYTQDVEASEVGKVYIEQARMNTTESFEKAMAQVEPLVASEQFDQLKHGLLACTELYKRFYANPQHRETIKKRIKTAWAKIPELIRIELLLKMAGYAHEQGDTAQGLKHLEEAASLMDVTQWRPRFVVVPMMQLAQTRYRLGDKEGALKDIQKTLAYYNSQEEKIINIDRAQLLVAVAETYAECGDQNTALKMYRRAVEAGMVNPNSRPRATDLTKTCCSMAVQAIEPDEALWQRLREIKKGLGDPW